MTAERKIRLLIAFDGTPFNGWQRQKHDVSIQEEIEKCLTVMTTKEVALHGAGRTDAGVHAEGMVAHFSTLSSISCPAFHKGLNSMLPYSIRILNVQETERDFHSRFSAQGKRYEYTIYNGAIMPPCKRLYCVHIPYRLNFPAIDNCLQLLQGTHDFSSFENAGSRDKNCVSRKGAVRTIFTAERKKTGDYHSFTFIGDGFLRQMVRNMVGTLLTAGRGQITIDQFRQTLEACDRNAGGPTAPAHGLTLKEVLY
ncbi:tRNA pseudouridine(38-40) synthase TruA [Desulfopila sp. IMCC35008]|uniref:tRNA pseudouridine(38-40) synthase TruA n=1 Tax=Desulfopila sp. IMCC35008 TaxID=2653858 RepID=UPI0013D10346|nr:tRNA pseudouridine(38-40) synthase TruA [Desulfopila sp. IMCC35008]